MTISSSWQSFTICNYSHSSQSIFPLTWWYLIFLSIDAYHASIFGMVTVIHTPSIVRTHSYTKLVTLTRHFIEPDGAGPLTVHSVAGCIRCCVKSQLSTDDIGILDAPVVITYGSPFTIIVDLNSAL